MWRHIGFRCSFLCLSTLLIGGIGCSTLDPHQSDYSRTSLGVIDYDRAFEACEKVMRSEFGSLTCNRDMMLIESKPHRYYSERSRLSEPPMRRVAKLRLGERHSQWWAYLEICIERQETQVYQAFDYQRSGRDFGTLTPMESSSHEVASRREVWTKVRRQRSLETQMLAQIRQELGIQSRQAETESTR